MSFTDLLKMKDGKEKEEIVNGLTDVGFSAYEKFLDMNKQVVNQTGKKIDANIQVANQTND